MAEAKKEKWQELLDATRANYEKTVKVITDLQQETEKVINTLVQKGTEFSEDSAKMAKDWIEKTKKIGEGFQKEVETSIKKAMEMIPDLKKIEFPFKAQFEEMAKKMEEQMKKVFESFKLK